MRAGVCPLLGESELAGWPRRLPVATWTLKARLRARGPGAPRGWALLALEALVGATTWLFTLSPFTPNPQQTSAGGGGLGTESFPRIGFFSPQTHEIKLR